MKVPKIPSIQNYTSASDQHLRDTTNYQKIVESRSERPNKQLNMLIRHLNLMAEQTKTNIKFTLHSKSGQYVVRMTYSQTNEIIEEITPENFLVNFSDVEKFSGLLFDQSI